MSSFTNSIGLLLFSTALLAGCGGGGSDSGSGSNSGSDTDTGGDTTNSTPVISGLDATVSVDENQTSVITVSASDADGDILSYSLSGTDASLLSISPNGVISFNSAPEFDDQSSFSLTVSVSDGSLSVAQDLTIELIELVDAGMTITSEAFKDTGSEQLNLPLRYSCDANDGGTSPLLSWSGVPDSALYLALTMHSVNDDDSLEPQFTLFNIDATASRLEAGDFSIGTAAQGDMTADEIAAAGGMPYAAPCAEGAGSETQYIFTLSALSGLLPLTETATQDEVNAAIADFLIDDVELVTRRVRYDADAIAADAHVPTTVPSTCAEKTAHFNEYSSVIASIECSEADNEIAVVAHIADGLKTTLSDQQNSVGIEQWIGRVSLPSQSGLVLPVEPTFLTGVNNNIECDGTAPLGLTVDGQLILTYYKQGGTATGATCGATDGVDYSGRDTIVLGEVDQCYGHSPNGEGYHMHGAPVCLMDVHDPSKPIAYMADGIPLYFGEGGGTIIDTDHALAVAGAGDYVTDLNYGAGLYEHLNYFPSDVKDGSNPLNDCNAYDLNGDGSEYVYYTTKDAPYTIGCFMGTSINEGTPADNTRLTDDRSGFEGWTLGAPQDVVVTSNYYGEFNAKTYNITEVLVEADTSFWTTGDTAQVLWRVLDETDADFSASATCFEFRYRANKEVTDSDETEVLCAEGVVADETLDFTPFGS